MTLLQLVIIAVVQGITEFLPISSSGPLILISFFTGFKDQGPLIDVAVHVGSLLAIIVYFFKDVLVLARGGFARVQIAHTDDHAVGLHQPFGDGPSDAPGRPGDQGDPARHHAACARLRST